MQTATAAANRQRSASHEGSGSEAPRLAWSRCLMATPPTPSSSRAATRGSSNLFWRPRSHEVPSGLPSTSSKAQSPVRVVEQTGREGGWINRFLDREYVRRLAEKTLRTYAHNLLHFVRWWESVHHTGDIVEGDLAESTLLDYVRFQSGPQPRPSGSTINDRVALADRALRNEFPDAPCQIARGFHQAFLRRRPMGIGRPRVAISRLRVK